MKNVLIKSFVFAIVFIFAGCSNEEQIKVVPDSENQELVLYKNDYYTVYAIEDITSLQKEIDVWNKQFALKTKGKTEDNFQLEEIVKSSEFVIIAMWF